MFKKYSNKNPLVYLHVYKTAGSSLRNVFEVWFGNDFVEHQDGMGEGKQYLKKKTCTTEYIESHYKQYKSAPMFFGHFNSHNYVWPKECDQFITILRDPFELQVSAYFYGKKIDPNFTEDNIEEYILKSDFHYGFTKVFTRETINFNNYKQILSEYFIAIGSLKNYSKTLELFSNVLNKPVKNFFFNLKANSAENTKKSIPYYLKKIHEERFPLEYEIYNYINKLYNY